MKAALDQQKPVPGHGSLDQSVLCVLRVGPVQLEVGDFVVPAEQDNCQECPDFLCCNVHDIPKRGHGYLSDLVAMISRRALSKIKLNKSRRDKPLNLV